MDSVYLGYTLVDWRWTLGTLMDSGHLGMNSIHLEIDSIHQEMDYEDQDMIVRNL